MFSHRERKYVRLALSNWTCALELKLIVQFQMFILGKLHTIRNMIILIQKPKIRFIFNSQKPKNSVISTNICKIIIKLLSILVPNQTNFVTAKCHLDPANLNSQTRPQSHEFNNIHTHPHTHKLS